MEFLTLNVKVQGNTYIYKIRIEIIKNNVQNTTKYLFLIENSQNV